MRHVCNTLQPLPALCCSWLLRASVLHRLQSSVHRLQSSCGANCWSTSSTDSCGWQNSNSFSEVDFGIFVGLLWLVITNSSWMDHQLRVVYPQIVVSPWPAKILALAECPMNVFWGSRENHRVFPRVWATLCTEIVIVVMGLGTPMIPCMYINMTSICP